VVSAARAAASGFPHRVLPHTLSGKRRENEPEQALERFADSEPGAAGAIEYGLWWHGLMEALPWADGKSWDAAFRGMIASCPEPDRGSAEWTLFLGSDICAMLSRKGMLVAAETPFLNALDAGKCVEGFVDLVARPPGGGPWLVVDWKTDRIEAARMAETASLYAPQIRAYAEALSRVLPGAGITALVYFTAVGKHAEITL
jgi:ATP-dependent exoDNAse (exonuclease V) beta subunit